MDVDISLPTIPQFFAKKNILITGGSGFLGKALTEKLLRSCPDVGNVYLLIRAKKGNSASNRLKQITDNAIFDKLRKERLEALKKLIVVTGDVQEISLGLSEDDRSALIENVNIVYHVAASVRFNDSLSTAILLNTRGTRETVSLALEMKKLDLFVNVSTAYSNSDRFFVEEKMYPPPADWKKMIEIAEHLDNYTLNCFTHKYMGSHANTYTFSKNLAEHVVYDMCSGRIPAVIFRPSIVSQVYEDPLPGWLDNLNGPTGVAIAAGSGLMRSIRMQPGVQPDYIPADLVVKGLIAVTWYEASQIPRSLEPSVYNGCGGTKYTVDLAELVDMCQKIVWEHGMEMQLCHPAVTYTTSFSKYYIKVIFSQLLPAILVDLLLKLVGKQPRLVKIQRKIYVAASALEHFTLNNFTFVNDKFLSINKKLLPRDTKDFYFVINNYDAFTYICNGFMAVRKLVLHEDPKKVDTYKRKAQRNKRIYQVVIFLFWATVTYYTVLRVMEMLKQLDGEMFYSYIHE